MADVPSKMSLPEEQDLERKLDEVMRKAAANLPSELAAEKQPANLPNSPDITRVSSHQSLLSPTSYLVLFLIVGVVVIAFLDWKGKLPLFNRSSSASQESAPITKPAVTERAYVLIANRQGKLYYFDQQQERIIEMSLLPATSSGISGSSANTTPIEAPTTFVQRGAAKMIPEINKVLLSPNEERVALIANRDRYRSHIFVLDFAKLNSPSESLTRWTEKLPPGYSIHTNDTVAWSPDDQALAFVASKEDQPDLFIATSKGSLQRVTYNAKNIGTVLWLDVERLAFVADLEGRDQMYVISRNTGVTELTQ